MLVQAQSNKRVSSIHQKEICCDEKYNQYIQFISSIFLDAYNGFTNMVEEELL